MTEAIFNQARTILSQMSPIEFRAHLIVQLQSMLSPTADQDGLGEQLASLGKLSFSAGDTDGGILCLLAAWRLGVPEEELGIVAWIEGRRPDWLEGRLDPATALPTLDDLRQCPLPVSPEQTWAIFGTPWQKEQARQAAEKVGLVLFGFDVSRWSEPTGTKGLRG